MSHNRTTTKTPAITLRKEDLSIIIVDDLQFSREVVKSGLMKAGFSDIRTASSADEGMFQLNQRRAHVVLADFWMPGLNGLELTDLIRRWDENNDRYTGVILLTAEDATSSIVVAFDRGVDDFISKSANQYELAARVYGAARNAFQQNDLRERARSMSSHFIRIKQFSQQDPETSLPNQAQMAAHLQALVAHCAARGGGVAVGVIRVSSEGGKIRRGTLMTVANSIRLALRPLDMVARLDENTFAVVLGYGDPLVFDTRMFKRLVSSIKRHTNETTDEGKPLNLATGIWHAHDFEPLPTANEIIESALNSIENLP